MCGRFVIYIDEEEIRDICREVARKAYGTDHLEICPTDVASIFTDSHDSRESCLMGWGFPKWDGSGVIINARAETVLSKKMFAASLRERPAVIPCSGFYEWKAVPGQKKKDKFLFRAPGDAITWLAGFWKRFPDAGDIQERFVILTTAANESMAEYHDRMPVILARHEIAGWLRGENLREVLERVPVLLQVEKASPPERLLSF